MKKKISKQKSLDIHGIKAYLNHDMKHGIIALNHIKQKIPSPLLFDNLKKILSRENIEKLNVSVFPGKVKEICDQDGMLKVSSLANEIIWSISVVLLFRKEISNFVKLSKPIEPYAINGNKESYTDTLNEIESSFGLSLWLIQNKISAMQHWYGNDAKREFVKELRVNSEDNLLIDIILYFTGRRVEGTSVPGYLQSELSKLLSNPEAKTIHDYVRAKVFDGNDLSFEQIPLLLCFDYKSSIIDLYESIVIVLRWVVSDENHLKVLKPLLIKPVHVLYGAVKDERLLPILIALDIEFEINYSEEREKIIENFALGNNFETLRLSKNYLEKTENADDISILIIALKAEKFTEENNSFTGLLNDIAEDIRKVLAFDMNSYSSALSLNNLNDKFMNHSWSNFIKVAVMNELSVQDFSPTLDYLRDLYARESRVTPFSFLLSKNDSYIKKYLSANKIPGFSISKKLIKIATLGKSEEENLTEFVRKENYLKYLGRYYLAKKQYDEALNVFYEMLELVKHSDALKCYAFITAAYVRSGNINKAIETLVSTFIEWEDIPTALPFVELIELLEDPDIWPESICLPITLALYTNFFKSTKLPHLRLAFERFNLNNDINSPNELVSNVGLEQSKYLQLYLKTVWKPEVMGQTLLYNGTREIEEARIQVCKLLLELDPSNATDYQTEIRERVKNLELAKVAKMVDQSRVYVDVTAIKNTLKSKLSNVYSKYKSTMLNEKDDSAELVEALEDAFGGLSDSNTSITKMMSQLHLVGGEDNQFAAIYAEITNEFLLGEHGLNTYLSTRVRHGKFSNAIRKPIADEYLITEISEKTGKYETNSYWSEMLTELNDNEKYTVLLLLESFGKKIDEIITYVRDELIQVNVKEDLSSNNLNNHALFTYRTSNVERMYAQTKMKSLESIDSFIDFCIDSLWEKTDDNLLKVKNLIQADVKIHILRAFETLNESLGQMSCNDRLGELHNHIARAKTNIQHQISNVATWFTRSEVYDRPDYTLDFPVLIAKTMVANLVSGVEQWGGISIKSDNLLKMMPGRTLDGMVDVYCATIENAIEHSKMQLNDLRIEVFLVLDSGNFSVKITNNINTDNDTSYYENKIELIREEIRKKDTRVKAQKEKGSGFHKIWSTINSPQYKDPKLSFEYKENSFEVNIEFTIETSDD